MDLKIMAKRFLGFLWAIITLVLYFRTHESYQYALLAGKRIAFVSIPLLFFAGWFYAYKKKKNWALKACSGIGIVAFIFLILFISQIILLGVFETPGPVDWAGMLVLDLSHLITVVTIITATGLNGYYFAGLFDLNPKDTLFKSSLFALGIIIITFYNFFLGYVHWLRIPFTWIPFIWPFLFAPLKSWRFVKALWLHPFEGLKRIQSTGWIAVGIMVFFASLNLLEGIRPIPKGYDALSQYYNLIQIMGDTDQLVEGFGAYNWLLYIGWGKFAFGWDSIAFTFSNNMVLLSAIALFFLSKKLVSSNVALIISAFFMATPLVTVVPGLQQKVEGGILLFSIISMHVLLAILEEGKINFKYLLLFGILCGYLFGIKYSSLILILSMLTVMVWYFGNFWTLVAAVGIGMGGILLLQLDAYSGMDLEHTFRDRSLYIFFMVALGAIVLSFFDSKVQWKQILTGLIIWVGGFMLCFLPWLGKHALETQSLQVTNLLNGSNRELLFDFEGLKIQIQNEKSNQ